MNLLRNERYRHGGGVPFYALVVHFTIVTFVFATARQVNVLVFDRLILDMGCGDVDMLDVILANMTSLKDRLRYMGITVSIASGSITDPIFGALTKRTRGLETNGMAEPTIYNRLNIHVLPIDEFLSKRPRRVDWVGRHADICRWLWCTRISAQLD